MRKPPGGRSKEQHDMLQRVFCGLPIRDAEGDLLITVKQEDGENAKPRDVANCVFSKTCNRLFGSTRVVFFRHIVYVDLPDAGGVGRTVYRFRASKAMADAIEKYDSTLSFDTGTYRLGAPGPSSSLDRRKEYEAARRARRTPAERKKMLKRQVKRRALIKSKAHTVKTMSEAGIAGMVRSGTGLVQTKFA